ncbi:MAG TPA: hypothetical protein VFV63_18525 [Ilumatobacteraceae bacterium]|nr:hypothetical protein [Ilumatobacteraceae bacterium]
MQHLEFTIEPFVEGNPGRHVVAAVEAASELGADVDFGPFGSSCTVDAMLMPDVVAAVVRAAFSNGATHVNLDVSADPGGTE